MVERLTRTLTEDRFRDRLTMIHILSRQAQEVDLLQGRIDGPKVRALIDSLLPVGSMDEVFICGPEAMIAATQAALVEAGVPSERVHTERFTSPRLEGMSPAARQAAIASHMHPSDESGRVALTVVLDGKPHEMHMGPGEHVLDVGLTSGLDLPYSCKGGVCCTCRARVLEGRVEMEKTFTLEPWEIANDFVLTCQARPDRPVGGELRRALSALGPLPSAEPVDEVAPRLAPSAAAEAS